jgi:hypothetical protein
MLQGGEVRLCQWKPGELTLDDAVPDLQTTVGRRESWRAVIVCPDKCPSRKHTFNVIEFEPDTSPLSDRGRAGTRLPGRKKFAAYEARRREPLRS